MGFLNAFIKNLTPSAVQFYLFLFSDGAFTLSEKSTADTKSPTMRLLFRSFGREARPMLAAEVRNFQVRLGSGMMLPEVPAEEIRRLRQAEFQHKAVRFRLKYEAAADRWQLEYLINDMVMPDAPGAVFLPEYLGREYFLRRICASPTLPQTLEELIAETRDFLTAAEEVNRRCAGRKGNAAFDMSGEMPGEVLYGAARIRETFAVSEAKRNRSLKTVRKALPEIRTHLAELTFDRACPEKLNTALTAAAVSILEMPDTGKCPCRELLGTAASSAGSAASAAWPAGSAMTGAWSSGGTGADRRPAVMPGAGERFPEQGPCLWLLASHDGFYVHRKEERGNVVYSAVECPCCGALYERQEEKESQEYRSYWSYWTVSQTAVRIPETDPRAALLRRNGNRFAIYFRFSSDLFAAVCGALGRFLEDQGYSYAPSSRQATGRYAGFTVKIRFWGSSYNVNGKHTHLEASGELIMKAPTVKNPLSAELPAAEALAANPPMMAAQGALPDSGSGAGISGSGAGISGSGAGISGSGAGIFGRRKSTEAAERACHLTCTWMNGTVSSKGETGVLDFEQGCNLNEITNQRFENMKEYLRQRFLVPAAELENSRKNRSQECI